MRKSRWTAHDQRFIVNFIIMSRHVTSCHVMARHVTSCHVMSRHVTCCHVMLRHVTSCNAMPRHFPSRHVTSRYFTSCHVESRGTVTRPTLHCQLTFFTRNSFKLGITVFADCPEGCWYHTASVVYNLVLAENPLTRWIKFHKHE